jgi:hypothetical protein
VSHVDRRRFNALLELLDLIAGGCAQLGVKVGQRPIEQKDGGIANQRARHGDALPLAPRQLAGPAVE